MAQVQILSQPINREELKKFLPNFQLIKAFENMSQDVSTNLPNAIAQAITGPGTSVVDRDVVIFDGTSGSSVKDSGVSIDALALLASPHFVGVPTAPTALPGTSTTQLATTAFVASSSSGFGFVVGPASAADNNIALFNGATGKVIKDSGVLLNSLAPLASPAFTGNPTAPTPSAGDNDTSVATTAFTNTIFAAPPALGNTTPASVAATTITASSTITPNQTAGIVGTTTNNNANAGSVGEFLTATTASTAVISGTVLNATSISLTAGDWEVSGSVQLNPSVGTAMTLMAVGVSIVSATRPAFFQENLYQAAFGANGQAISTPIARIIIGATTTVYLTVLVLYTGGTGVTAAPGYIRARRVR